MGNCSHVTIVMMRQYHFKKGIQQMRPKIEELRSRHIKIICKDHINVKCFPLSSCKEHARSFLRTAVSSAWKTGFHVTRAERPSMPPGKKNSVRYLLGLSISSIAERSFCLAFLLIWDPRQTFTRLVNCFVEYSCSKKEDANLVHWYTWVWSMQKKNRQIDNQDSVGSYWALQISGKQWKL